MKKKEEGDEEGGEQGVMPALDESLYHRDTHIDAEVEGGKVKKEEEGEGEEVCEEEVPVPFDAVGMIIGRAGETIRSLIKETGVQALEFRKMPEQRQVQVCVCVFFCCVCV